MVEIGGAPPGFLREIGGTFTPPDMAWATHLIDTGIDVRFQDKYGLLCISSVYVLRCMSISGQVWTLCICYGLCVEVYDGGERRF